VPVLHVWQETLDPNQSHLHRRVTCLLTREDTTTLYWVQEAGPVGVLSSGHLQTTSARPVASSKQRGVISRFVVKYSVAGLIAHHQPDDMRLSLYVGPSTLQLTCCRAGP
jgi:hypothetical protein